MGRIVRMKDIKVLIASICSIYFSISVFCVEAIAAVKVDAPVYVTKSSPTSADYIVIIDAADGGKQKKTAMFPGIDWSTGLSATMVDGVETVSVDSDYGADAIEYVIDGGGSAITTGVKGFLEIPYAATINRATVLCDQSGSIVVDVWKDTYANYPPTVADTITASAKPTVSAATKGQVTTLTGWTTAVSAGDIIGLNVDSASTVTRCTISLKVTK